jgi:hypothetical protein
MNTQTNNISLLLSPESTQAQCLFAIKQARNTSHALASLIALQAFIAATAQPSDRDTPAHISIKKIIEGHAATLRAQLLTEHANALAAAMRAKDCAAITRIHGVLSRNGFWQASQLAVCELDTAERMLTKEWAFAWSRDAKSRALAASGYPDALNFHKAEISPLEYAAMNDASNYLMNADMAMEGLQTGAGLQT